MAKRKMGRRFWAGAVLVAVTLTAGMARPAAGALTDMAGHWAAPLIAVLEAKGIVAGDERGRFNPDAPLSRAQMAKLIVVGLGNDKEAQLLAGYDSRFSDIPSWHWAKGYIESLAESAVTEGYPDGSFGPAEPLSRAQMAVFLVRATGLAEQARLMQYEQTTYRDDKAIPDWARGSIHLALSRGLMAGFEDGTFRPHQPITKAEGGAAIFRFLAMKGAAFHLAGTLLRFDPATLEGALRDEAGQERAFTMAPGAEFYRAGVGVSPHQIQPLDQVWVVLGRDGIGRFMDARYAELLGTNASVQGQTVSVKPPDGTTRTLSLQPGALIFVNGRIAPFQAVDGAEVVYVALDRESGAVRVLDAVKGSVEGVVQGYDSTRARLLVTIGEETQALPLSPDALLFDEGRRVSAQDLRPGEQARLVLDRAGLVTYLQAER